MDIKTACKLICVPIVLCNSVQGKKLVGMLVTKDSSVLLRVVKALKQDEVGYEASVQKFFADLDEMQQNQATQPASKLPF